MTCSKCGDTKPHTMEECHAKAWHKIDPKDAGTWPGGGVEVWWTNAYLSGGAVVLVRWNPNHHASQSSYWMTARVPEPPSE